MIYTNSELYNDNEVMRYKNKIMNYLIANSDEKLSKALYELLLNQECTNIELCENLLWKNIVPELFVDGTVTETQAYILFDIDIKANSRIDTYNNITLYFHILSHKSIVNVKNIGTRCDSIVSILCKIFKDKIFYSDGAIGIGKNHKTTDRVLSSPNNNYVARELIFTITDFDERVKNKI